MKSRAEKGRLGEVFAQRHLENDGYSIIERNYHSRYGEIDIIACKDVYIVFAEVKARSRSSLITPAEAVDRMKQHKIILTAQKFLSENEYKLQPRFDVIEVYLINGVPQSCVHIENAYSCD